jgi:hypothetical protein
MTAVHKPESYGENTMNIHENTDKSRHDQTPISSLTMDDIVDVMNDPKKMQDLLNDKRITGDELIARAEALTKELSAALSHANMV